MIPSARKPIHPHVFLLSCLTITICLSTKVQSRSWGVGGTWEESSWKCHLFRSLTQPPWPFFIPCSFCRKRMVMWTVGERNWVIWDYCRIGFPSPGSSLDISVWGTPADQESTNPSVFGLPVWIFQAWESRWIGAQLSVQCLYFCPLNFSFWFKFFWIFLSGIIALERGKKSCWRLD